MSQRIVVNARHGGFGLSPQAWALLEAKRFPIGPGAAGDVPEQYRAHPELVAVVERLGEKASGRYARLAVVDVPDGVEWQIEEYDGLEWVAEAHRKWTP